MNYARAFANSVVLPNGQVVTMGGQTYAVPFSDENSILNAELWDPSTGNFTVMAPEAEPRNYHSVGLLLPDGTVFSGGGGLCGSCSTNHPDGQIWSPPYLFNADGSVATRPTITSAPTSAATGQTITVTTGGPVSQFSMVRYGVATHTMDNDQRRIPLSIVSSSGDTYQLAIPSDPGIALAGPYMLFALNAQGTPSVSTTISITNVATQPPADSYGQAVFGSGPSIYWPLNDANGSTTAADLSGNSDTGVYSSRWDHLRSSEPGGGHLGHRRHPGRVQWPDRGVTAHHQPHHLLRGGVVQNHQRQRRPHHRLRQLTQRHVGRTGPTGVDVEQRPAQLRGLQRNGRTDGGRPVTPVLQRRQLAPRRRHPRAPTA